MPEGDTVFVVATRVQNALSGQRLITTDFRVPSIATTDLSGRLFEAAAARGKHLLFRIEENVTLHSHLKMEGSWHLYRPGERWRLPAHHARVVLETEPWTAVGFRLGVIELVPTDAEHTVVGHLGPDPLGHDWDPDEVRRRMAKHPDRAIADVLIDQTVVAGLGNVYKSEICFLKGLHPTTPVVSVPDLEGFVDLAARVIRANRAAGHQITTGDTRPGRRQWVYGRGGKRCLRCGSAIRRHAPTDERVTYWCPGCQPDVYADR